MFWGGQQKKGLFGNMRIITLAELFGLVKIFNRGNILMANRFHWGLSFEVRNN